jgi:hypothetical protein
VLKATMFPFALLHYDMCLHNSHIPFSRYKLSHTSVLDFIRLRYDLHYRITYILYTNYVPSNFSLRLDTHIYKVLDFVRLSNFSLRYFLECNNSWHHWTRLSQMGGNCQLLSIYGHNNVRMTWLVSEYVLVGHI